MWLAHYPATSTHTVCGVVKLNRVFDGDGSSVVAFYAPECIPPHDGYGMKYSIGITSKVLALEFFFFHQHPALNLWWHFKARRLGSDKFIFNGSRTMAVPPNVGDSKVGTLLLPIWTSTQFPFLCFLWRLTMSYFCCLLPDTKWTSVLLVVWVQLDICRFPVCKGL